MKRRRAKLPVELAVEVHINGGSGEGVFKEWCLETKEVATPAALARAIGGFVRTMVREQLDEGRYVYDVQVRLGAAHWPSVKVRTGG